MKATDNSPLDFLPNDLTPIAFGISDKDSDKVVDMEQVGLINQPGNASGKIKRFRNDVTPYSLGVMSNVRTGGLKQDLSSIFEMSNSPSAISLPAEFADVTKNRLYQSTHGITGESDPCWSTLSGYYNSFRSITSPETAPSFTRPQPKG